MYQNNNTKMSVYILWLSHFFFFSKSKATMMLDFPKDQIFVKLYQLYRKYCIRGKFLSFVIFYTVIQK